MRISVIGCGYLGAVHAAAMAKLGHEVIGIDVDAEKVARLGAGDAPFYEPELGDILADALGSGRLSFSTDPADIAEATVHFISVGTPQQRDGIAADLSYLNAAFESILPFLSPGDLVVGKSTVPVGTARVLAERLDRAARGVTLVWNPEFLREGFAVSDTISPDRLVYGVPEGPAGERAVELLNELYGSAVAAGTPVVTANYETAELVKVAANAFLATKISFINAMAEIAEVTGADVTRLADAIGYDDRIGRKFLNAGVGFGGGCLPKDIRAFTARAQELGRGESVAFLQEIDQINLRRRARVVQLTRNALGGSVVGRKIAVLGLAFKPQSDDVRDSPALDVAVQLHGLGARVVATDPQAIANSRRLHPQLEYEQDLDEVLNGADAVVLVTEWPVYRELDPERVAALAGNPLIVDARNCLEPSKWRAAGWTYQGLGRS
jgi:UDPglucose 6-dehydrogenase